MASGVARWGQSLAIATIGILVAACVLMVGWPLPWQERCSGDTCEAVPWIDWGRVDWSIPPRNIACAVHNPGPGDALMQPGDVCVESIGGRETSRMTYEQVREQRARQRVTTLAIIVLLTGVTPLAMTRVLVVRQRR